MKQHRIAAGGILFENDKVLLVRYKDVGNKTLLVCPGGGSNDEEGIENMIGLEKETFV